MQIVTRHWGIQDIDEDRILTFRDGIPGFPECRRFVLLGDEGSTVLWLQSADVPEVALPAAEAFSLFPDYEVELEDDDVAALQVADPKDVAIFVIITVRGAPPQASANLLAPLIINTATRLGRQKILMDRGYSVRHPLFPPAPARHGSPA